MMILFSKLILYTLLIHHFFCFSQLFQECQFNFLPMPHSCTLGFEQKILRNPCSILYQLLFQSETISESNQHIKELLDHYQQKTFNCASANVFLNTLEQLIFKNYEYIVYIKILDPTLRSVFSIQEESYSLKATTQNSTIQSATYVGFVRAIETFTQIPQCGTSQNKRSCNLIKLPIQIQDQPEFAYRGLMIDTSRHFLPYHMILQTIDALMYNKMNILHWHITDQDSFPLILDKHPEMAKYGSFSQEETYTTTEAKQIVRYALIRGVRVIPELDTPGHSASWGKAPQNNQITCINNDSYKGSLDVTLQHTYKLIKEIIQQIDTIFIDPIMHLGGNQANFQCLKNKSQFMRLENIIKESQFETYYRNRQRNILKQIDPNRLAMYWFRNDDNIKIEENDIVHWWGDGLPDTINKVVISNYGEYYLDTGVGNYYGGPYMTWLNFYQRNLADQISSYTNKENILGAEMCLWSELSNKYTHHMKIWIRMSSIAERLWNSEIRQIKFGVLRRLTSHERLMNRRGIPTSPATCQQCEWNSKNCE